MGHLLRSINPAAAGVDVKKEGEAVPSAHVEQINAKLVSVMEIMKALSKRVEALEKGAGERSLINGRIEAIEESVTQQGNELFMNSEMLRGFIARIEAMDGMK